MNSPHNSDTVIHTAQPAIRIKNLTHGYRRRQPVLKNVSLSVPRGSVYALLGPNGSGKSTLLKCVSGAVYPAKVDDFRILDGDALKILDLPGRPVYLPQKASFPAHLSGTEILNLIESLRNIKALHKDRLIADLDAAGFMHRPFGELSGGMRQKINVIQCFMFPFELALLDEPTASLDPYIATYVKQLIQKAHASGKTILFSSHIMSEVEEIATDLALLIDGCVHLTAKPDVFKNIHAAATLEEALTDFWQRQQSDAGEDGK
ncbi:MAG: ABC transporter ATP-binding protein [Leptospiraceae bacterium]|nr:ABC transporter ATP-binding protein [Leptospiraceae bacterium]